MSLNQTLLPLTPPNILAMLEAGLHTPEQRARLARILETCSTLDAFAWYPNGPPGLVPLRGIIRGDGSHPYQHGETTAFTGMASSWIDGDQAGERNNFQLKWKDRTGFVRDAGAADPAHPGFRREETQESLLVEFSAFGLFEGDGAPTTTEALLAHAAAVSRETNDLRAQQRALNEWRNDRAVLLQQAGIAHESGAGWKAWWMSHALRDRHGHVGCPRGSKDGAPRRHIPALTRACAAIPCRTRTLAIPTIPEDQAFAHLAAIVAALKGGIGLVSSDEVPFDI